MTVYQIWFIGIWKSTGHVIKVIVRLFLLIALFCLLGLPSAQAASPVRLAITAASGSGLEQEVVDYISNQFSGDPDVVVSTVNPDWYVLCNIDDNQNRFTGQIHSNGTVTVKTADGQIIGTFAAQKYNQDFSSDLGKPNNWQGAPLNKQLVQSATREVVTDLGTRATAKIKEAVQIELQARDSISQAESLADAERYSESIDILKKIGPDTVHYKDVQKLIVKLQMEKHALELVNNAEVKGKKGQYSEGIVLLKEVDPQTRYHKIALQLIARYKHNLELARLRTKNSARYKNTIGEKK